MYVSIAEAEGQLLALVRRAEAGEEVLLTHEGAVIAKIAPSTNPLSPDEKRAIIRGIVGRRNRKPDGGPDAARSQDFLYDEDGLPG